MAHIHVMFSQSLDGGALMSADERPFRSNRGTEGIAQNRLALRDAAGTKGWRPSVKK
jgi:hypothetical protein